VEVIVRKLPDSGTRISVADRGPGVPDAFREQIFHKFSQADASDTRSVGGTGLGLAISKELVERMGGRLGYDSVEGYGATFYVDLPACRDSATHGQPARDRA
jgi:signal transduction histidine kinase